MFAGPVAADCLDRSGQDAVRVAGGHTDPHAAHIDAEPPSGSGIVRAGPIRQAV
jgi:hypothetical protein